jgi:Cu/Ag efflux protein CusF
MHPRTILAALPALALLAGCAKPTPPAPLQLESTRKVEATVVAVQKDKRLVSLRGEGGETVTVECGPSVRNFDQIRVGDQVIASYSEAIGFALAPPGDTGRVSDAGVVAGRAPAGERPAAALGRFAQTTVTIDSVDPKSHTVTFTGQDGMKRAIPVMTTEGRAFASKLRPGDRVEVTYQEAVAISVEPGPAK